LRVTSEQEREVRERKPVKPDEISAEEYVRKIQALQGELDPVHPDAQKVERVLVSFMQVVLGYIQDHDENKHRSGSGVGEVRLD
jgi:hypothetical protein